jgi:osmotically-inducible protein OsmY
VSTMVVAMTNDIALRSRIDEELTWDPAVEVLEISIDIDDGIVTVSGMASSYPAMLAAVDAIKRVTGVCGVVDHLTVRTARAYRDADISAFATEAIMRNVLLHEGHVDVTVHHGKVALMGHLDSHFKRQAAEECVRYLEGVRNVINLISVSPRTTPDRDVRQEITSALARTTTVDTGRIDIDVESDVATLTGTVRSMAEECDVVSAAWRSGAIDQIVNHLQVLPTP